MKSTEIVNETVNIK